MPKRLSLHPVVGPQPARRGAPPQRLKPLTVALDAALLSGALLLATLPFAPPAAAQTPAAEAARKSYAIPAGNLEDALNRFARAAGVLLSFEPNLVRGKSTSGLQGSYTVQAGFAALLAGSGLVIAAGNDGSFTLAQASGSGSSLGTTVPTLPTVTVTEQALDPLVDEGFKAESQVSATKSLQSIRETPQAISVITQENLKARQVFDIGTALQTSAGVSLTGGTNLFSGFTHFPAGQGSIRGIPTGSAFNLSSDREDGFVSPIYSSELDLAPYERIEVLKGPSSTLYGRGSAGGFFNRVRKVPQRAFHAELAPTIGSFDFYRLEGDVTGPLSGSEKARGRLTAAYQSVGSFVDSVQGERFVVAPGLDIDLSPTTRLLLLGSYQRDNFIPNPGFPLVSDFDAEGKPVGKLRAPRGVPRSRFFGVPNEEENVNETTTGYATLEQDLGDNWLATLRFDGSTTQQESGSYAYAYGSYAGGATNLGSVRSDADLDSFSGELRLNGKFDLLGRPANVAFGVDHSAFTRDDRYLFTVGYFYDQGLNIYANNFADFVDDLPALGNTHQIQKRSGTGVYGQIQFRPLERLSVLLGGRYDFADTSVVNKSSTIIVPLPPPARDKPEAFTGRAGLTYDVSANMTAYGQYAQSFEPSISQGGALSTDANGNLVATATGILEPETGESFEAGLKTEWLDGKLGINAALFRIERQGIAIRVSPPGQAALFRSAGLLRSDGVELEINGTPLPGWNLSFGGSLLDPKFLGNKAEDPNAGRRSPGASDWQVGLFTSYELLRGPWQGLGAGVGLYAIGERGVRNNDQRIDGYERVDLSFFYNGFPNTQIALQVRNVFDANYVEGLFSAVEANQFGAPLSALLTVRHQFGK